MCKKFCKSLAKVDRMDCEIIMFEVERKVFPLYPIGIVEFDRLWCKILNYAILRFCTISMHIMLNTYVPNLKDRG
jgi:hypothetical protein